MPITRDFQDVLTDIGDGTLHQHLGDQLRRLALAVADTKKSGKLTVTFDLKCESSMVVLKAKYDAKIPQPSVDATSFYLNEAGDLTRENPRQQKLKNLDGAAPGPLRTVSRPKEDA